MGYSSTEKASRAGKRASASMSVNVDGFMTGLRARRSKIQAAARPAAQAAAEHCYLLARLFAPVSDDAHFFYGRDSKKTGVRYFFKPGNLRDAIYQAYSKDNSAKGKATYHLSWNRLKAPYGAMVENGTSRAPAHSFIRRAITTGKTEALQIMRAEFIARATE